MTELPVLTLRKGKSYNSIFVIVDKLTKMVYYEPVKITINAPCHKKVIIDVVIRHHGPLVSIITDWGSLFKSKFWSLLCYFLETKRKLSTAFHLQTNGWIERQNSTVKIYLRAFINQVQNNWTRLLLIDESEYNNAKNASIGHTFFKLNCGFHPQVFFKDNIDFWSRSCFANKLAKELRAIMNICQQNLLHTQEI